MEKTIPNNWVETDLMSIASVYTGKKDANYATELGEFTFFTCAFNPLKSDDYSFEGNVLILPGNGANVGEVFYFSGKFEAYQRTYVVDNILIDPKYTFYHFKRFWRELGVKEQYGSATNYIKIGNFKDYLISFPPLPEQKRIVAKLDDLFAHLDDVKTRLQKVPELLENFEQSIIDKAINGELLLLDSSVWKEGILNDVIQEKPRNGKSPRAVDYQTDIKSMTLSATTSGSFDSSYVKYLDIEKPPEDSHLWLKNGDILIQRSNSLEYVGTSAIYDGDDFDFIYPDLMMKVKANELMITEYLNYTLSSSRTKEYFRANATGTAGNMPKINQGIVMKTPVKIPPIDLQKEIVNQVESLLGKSNSIAEKRKNLQDKVDSLPQTILAKAFKGELVGQLKSDGDARDLLVEITKLKSEIKKRSK